MIAKYISHKIKFRDEIISDLNKEITNLEKRISLQTATDAYKDDLIDTLKGLVAYKDDAIDYLNAKLLDSKVIV